MINGTTSTGFNFAIDERVYTDWRLIEASADAQSGDVVEKVKGLRTMVNLIIGDTASAFFDHIKSMNDGFCPTESVMSEVNELMSANKTLKNS